MGFGEDQFELRCKDLTASILQELSNLNEDELSVMLQVARKMVRGKLKHGDLDLAGKDSKRDWDQEIREELLDMLNYAAIKFIAKGRT